MSGIIHSMSAGLTIRNTQYTVNTSIYTGPLDLLLQLIERAELDITRLALAQVTDQFLDYARKLPETTPEEVSAFLVIAARLVQIKSEALLPRPPQREPGEEDPGEALARQLIVYKRFKELGNHLNKRLDEGFRSYSRQTAPPKIETHFDLDGVSIDFLVEVARWLLAQEPVLPELGTVVPLPKITIREKIATIAAYLKLHPRGSFTQLIHDPALRLEIIVTFLALLELVKRRMVQTRQAGIFGPIDFEPAEAWSDDTSFDLEFGE